LRKAVETLSVCAAFSRFLGIENMGLYRMPRKSTFFLLPLRLSIVFKSLN